MISSSANLDSYIYATKMELCYINLHKNRDKTEKAAPTSPSHEANNIIEQANKSTTVMVQNCTMRPIKSDIWMTASTIIQCPVISLVAFTTLSTKLSVKYTLMGSFLFLLIHTSLSPVNMLGQIILINDGQTVLINKIIHKRTVNEISNNKWRDCFQRRGSISGRPIISQCLSPTMTICHYMDQLIGLGPLVQKQYTYVRDTKDSINQIPGLWHMRCSPYIPSCQSRNFSCLLQKLSQRLNFQYEF